MIRKRIFVLLVAVIMLVCSVCIFTSCSGENPSGNQSEIETPIEPENPNEPETPSEPEDDESENYVNLPSRPNKEDLYEAK